MIDHYWATTRHLGLDDRGRLWLLMPPAEDDRPLGHVWTADVPEGLEFEADWLWGEWEDAPDPADLRAEALATYYGGLMP